MDTEFAALLERDVGSLSETARSVLAEQVPAHGATSCRVVEAAIAAIDRRLSEQLNVILHHPDFQQMEATWRGLDFLVGGIENSFMHKIKVLDISKQELAARCASSAARHGTRARSSRRYTKRNTASSAASRSAC